MKVPGATIWSFDIGKASLGEAVRVGDRFLHAASWLVPADFARRGPATSPGSPANRFRAWRTRTAHLARETRLREVLSAAGLEALQARDPRLTREFPNPTDETCYTSCLLRIQLLRGEPLAGWQIFKALHSAIQRRGYDPRPAWLDRRSERPATIKEDTETAQRLDAYRRCLEDEKNGVMRKTGSGLGDWDSWEFPLQERIRLAHPSPVILQFSLSASTPNPKARPHSLGSGLMTIGSGSVFNGTVTLQIGGLVRGTDYDAIDVGGAGALTFGGTLEVSLIDDFAPALGDSFDLFHYTTATGTFDTLNLPTLTAGLLWDTSNLYTTGTLSIGASAIPEPATLALFLGGCALAAGLVRRRRMLQSARNGRPPPA